MRPTVMGTYPGLVLPRVPGHEVVGRIEALGSGVSKWKIGQRVGVGFFDGEDGVCELCRRGDIVNCQNPVIPGVTGDGGYAEVMIAEARGIAYSNHCGGGRSTTRSHGGLGEVRRRALR